MRSKPGMRLQGVFSQTNVRKVPKRDRDRALSVQPSLAKPLTETIGELFHGQLRAVIRISLS